MWLIILSFVGQISYPDIEFNKTGDCERNCVTEKINRRSDKFCV